MRAVLEEPADPPAPDVPVFPDAAADEVVGLALAAPVAPEMELPLESDPPPSPPAAALFDPAIAVPPPAPTSDVALPPGYAPSPDPPGTPPFSVPAPEMTPPPVPPVAVEAEVAPAPPPMPPSPEVEVPAPVELPEVAAAFMVADEVAGPVFPVGPDVPPVVTEVLAASPENEAPVAPESPEITAD
ncbi:MAG: hypothetical protein ACRD0M_07865 [Acidimicrobiales bacterium]